MDFRHVPPHPQIDRAALEEEAAEVSQAVREHLEDEDYANPDEDVLDRIDFAVFQVLSDRRRPWPSAFVADATGRLQAKWSGIRHQDRYRGMRLTVWAGPERRQEVARAVVTVDPETEEVHWHTELSE